MTSVGMLFPEVSISTENVPLQPPDVQVTVRPAMRSACACCARVSAGATEGAVNVPFT
jgi:hypothetical protein